ncbi:MAG TPA: helix-turn-helix transcriptional regulator [Anaerolineales bacterium]|nr:helix-turn-helix transcriptional regulator [Anaerolineales bacterium]
MNKRQWSQADLARFADLNRAVVNKLLNGKTRAQPSTLEAIARAFKLPVESLYRAAGLLPDLPENESLLQEISHIVQQIRNPQRKATALALLRALITEDEGEQRTTLRPGK